MNTVVIYSVISLSSIGVLAAIILYVIAEKFKVIEDPRIDVVNDLLPAANCGGCGYAGCRNFAEEIIKKESLEGFSCPPGGDTTMQKIAEVLGLEAGASVPKVAVLRCAGSRTNAPQKVVYDGATTCAYVHMLFAGESGCPNGCIGLGDCVESCKFDAMYIDKESNLPVISDTNCVACGACVKACPRAIIEMRNKGKKDRRIFVCCINKEKGGPAKKNCSVACIGCGKCVKACKFDAITLENNLAYIDYEKCKLCRKCAPECPTTAIVELNFPPRKVKTEATAKSPVAQKDKQQNEAQSKEESKDNN